MAKWPDCASLITLAALAVAAASCDSRDAASGRSVAAPTAPVTAAGTAAVTPTSGAIDGRSCSEAAALPAVYCRDVSGMERASVVKIIDGDTFDVIHDGRDERIRIFGIDTPERGDRCYGEASSLLASLAESVVYLQTDARKVDRSGRLLRYVYDPDGLSIDAVMIAEGAAFAWTRDGALRDDLVALEQQARLGRVGCLWE